MIIDDELDITNLFKEILMNAGYQVEGFTDPLKALAECNINHDKYILIISDVKMPKMTGIELVKKIAKIDGNIPPQEGVHRGEARRRPRGPADRRLHQLERLGRAAQAGGRRHLDRDAVARARRVPVPAAGRRPVARPRRGAAPRAQPVRHGELRPHRRLGGSLRVSATSVVFCLVLC